MDLLGVISILLSDKSSASLVCGGSTHLPSKLGGAGELAEVGSTENAKSLRLALST